MNIRPVTLTALLTIVALAGCSDAPPSGDISGGALAVDLQGDADVEFTAAQYPAGATGEPTLYEALCDPSGTIPGGECVPAKTEVTVMLHTAPEPNANNYVAFFVGSGDPAELSIGALTQGDDGMWQVHKVFEGENYQGTFDAIEVRMGPTVIATGPASGGNLVVADSLGGVTVTGTYDGKSMDLEVSGLNDEESHMGWLVGLNEGGELAHQESFPISNGAVTYTANKNIGDYEEFHIHVSGSLVNVYKTVIA